MDAIPYETGAYYIFNRKYFDLKRLYHINQINAYFVIRKNSRLNYEVKGHQCQTQSGRYTL